MNDNLEQMLNIEEMRNDAEHIAEPDDTVGVASAEFDMSAMLAMTPSFIASLPTIEVASYVETPTPLVIAEDVQRTINTRFTGIVKVMGGMTSKLSRLPEQVSQSLRAVGNNIVSATEAVTQALKPYANLGNTIRQQIDKMALVAAIRLKTIEPPNWLQNFNRVLLAHKLFRKFSLKTAIRKWTVEAELVELPVLARDIARLRAILLTGYASRRLACELLIKSTVLILRRLDMGLLRTYDAVSGIKSLFADYDSSKNLTASANSEEIAQKTRTFQRKRLPDWLLSTLAAKLNHKIRYLNSPQQSLYVDYLPGGLCS